MCLLLSLLSFLIIIFSPTLSLVAIGADPILNPDKRPRGLTNG
jgi:hypothetical protein